MPAAGKISTFLRLGTKKNFSPLFTLKLIISLVAVYSTGVVRLKTLMDVTIWRSSNDGNNQRSTAFVIIAWHSIHGRQQCHQQHHHNKLQSRASRDDVLIEIESEETTIELDVGVVCELHRPFNNNCSTVHLDF